MLKALYVAAALALAWPLGLPTVAAALPQSNLTRFSDRGSDWANGVSGRVGFKIMWNQEQKPEYVDNVGTEWITEQVNGKGDLERTYGSAFWRRRMGTGRLYTDPKPTIPHNSAMCYTEQFGPLLSPNNRKGVEALNFQYLGSDVPDDSYMYLPE